MYSNSNILPVQKNQMKTSFYQVTSSYTSFYSFGSIHSVPISVYIGFIVSLIIIYLVWRIFIQTFMKIIRKVCKGREAIFDENYQAQDDFYKTVNFGTLRVILKED